MINTFSLSNFGPIESLSWDNLGPINLIIGGNGLGKTITLKALYSAIKSVEEYKRGDDPRKIHEVLADKMYWTFQAEKLGDLQLKGAKDKLRFTMQCSEGQLDYSLTDKASTTLVDVSEKFKKRREDNSIFLPAKEVLSLFNIIIKTRDDKLFGFDDTYLDLAKALRNPTQKGRNFEEFKDARQRLEAMLDGKVAYNNESGRWTYTRNRSAFSMQTTSEGIKKIAILDTLLGNRYLTPNSIVFIDEPESALHPQMLTQFLEIIGILAGKGLQFFIASHSYYVIKKLLLIAKTKDQSIPVLSLEKSGIIYSNLLDGMPDNEIINESIRLYDEEIQAALG
jgi:AAA15 family ATPase/GTPase